MIMSFNKLNVTGTSGAKGRDPCHVHVTIAITRMVRYIGAEILMEMVYQ